MGNLLAIFVVNIHRMVSKILKAYRFCYGEVALEKQTVSRMEKVIETDIRSGNLIVIMRQCAAKMEP